jgi:hypothetical protein
MRRRPKGGQQGVDTAVRGRVPCTLQWLGTMAGENRLPILPDRRVRLPESGWCAMLIPRSLRFQWRTVRTVSSFRLALSRRNTTRELPAAEQEKRRLRGRRTRGRASNCTDYRRGVTGPLQLELRVSVSIERVYLGTVALATRHDHPANRRCNELIPTLRSTSPENRTDRSHRLITLTEFFLP